MISLEHIEIIKNVVALTLAYLMIASIAGAFQAWIASKVGDSTARSFGFMTLNPFMHVELMSLVIMPIGYLIFGVVIGLSRPVPIIWHHITRSLKWLKFTLVACAQPLAILIMLFGLLVLRLIFLVSLPTWSQAALLTIISAVVSFAIWFIPYQLLMSLTQIYIHEQEKRGVVSNQLLLLLVPLLGAVLLIDVSRIALLYMLGGMEWVLELFVKSIIG